MATIIDTTALGKLGDHLCEDWARYQGNSTAALGLGDTTQTWGSSKAWKDLCTDLLTTTSADAVSDLFRTAVAMRDNSDAAKEFLATRRSFIRTLNAHIRKCQPTYPTLDSYLQYLNSGAGTKWQCQWDGRLFRPLYNAYYGSSNYPSVENCYFEVLQGTLDVINHLYTNGLGKFVASGAGAGSFTKATVEGELIDGGSTRGAIDTSKYTPGVMYLKVSGLTGTGNVTVTADVWDPATKTTATGKTFITSVTASGDTALAIGAGTAPTDSRPFMVTNITIAAGISAGTFYVESRRASGRALCK